MPSFEMALQRHPQLSTSPYRCLEYQPEEICTTAKHLTTGAFLRCSSAARAVVRLGPAGARQFLRWSPAAPAVGRRVSRGISSAGPPRSLITGERYACIPRAQETGAPVGPNDVHVVIV